MTSGMQTTKRLLLVAGAALITAGQVNGFGVKTHSRFAAVKNLPAAPLHALFMDCDTDDKPCSPDRGDDSSINNRHSASDWHYNVMSLPKSSVLRDIRNPVLTIAVWSGIVSVFQQILASSSSRMLRTMASDMCIGATPHSFLVSSLGLLLVFRTNTAYQRFYEGRKIWENILSISRNLSRTIRLYEDEIGSARKQRLLNLAAAFPYLLRHHIRPGCLCESETALSNPAHGLLLEEPSIELVETRHEGDKQTGGTTDSFHDAPKRECWVDKRNLPWCLTDDVSLKQLAKAQNRPLWVCDRIGRELMNIPYGPNYTSRERLALLGQIEKLTNTVGQCERIHQTAVPLNYARHSLRSLTLWLITLPFALVKDLGLLTGPVVGVMAWLLFGVYQIGHSIEDPFQGSLRLSILCDAIRKDVLGESYTTAFSVEKEHEPISVEKEHEPFSVEKEHDFSEITLIPTPHAVEAAALMGQFNATWSMASV